MTQKSIYTDENDKQQKMPGWFSWRHKTRAPHDEARETYLATHGPAARRGRAFERKAAAVKGAPHVNTRGHALGRCSCTSERVA